MRHFMKQFGPCLKLPWTKLEAPELTDQLLERIVEQSDAQADGASVKQLERLRDDCIVSVMQGLKKSDYGAGHVLKKYEEKLLAEVGADASIEASSDEGLLRIHSAIVKSDWIDYNGHMTESRYLEVFGDATDALLKFIGANSADYLEKGYSYYTVETHIMNKKEAHAGDGLVVSTQILKDDPKRIHLFHSIEKADTKEVLATAEQMLLHVNTKAGKACEAEEAVLKKLRKISERHANLEKPADSGRSVGAPRT